MLLCTPVISVFRKLRQEDGELKASLSHTRAYLKKNLKFLSLGNCLSKVWEGG